MRKNTASIDGFVPRNRGNQIGKSSPNRRNLGQADTARSIGRADQPLIDPGTPRPASVSKSEIDESLRDIEDDNSVSQTPKRRRRLFGRKEKSAAPKRRIIKRIVITLVVIVLAIAAFIGIKAFIASSNIFQGNLFGLFQSKPLKTDSSGRTNILVYGTSGSYDDLKKTEDLQHPGAELTDTIMVLSLDQKNNNGYMISLPRDLYIRYDKGCSSGYTFKINELYKCVLDGGASEEAAAKELENKVSEVTGLSVQYYAHVNWAVVVDAVNAVGGVNIDVKGDGSCAGSGYPADSVIDANMKINYAPGNHHMNGTQALLFSRARNDAVPYQLSCGLGRGDYDRQQNQQKVIKALQTKAVSAGTVTNLGKVTSLIDALGKNLRTSFDTSEVQTLMRIAKEIPGSELKSISLVDDKNQLIGGQMYNNQSIQVPLAGMYDYSAIKGFIARTVYASDITREAASIMLYNGGAATGYAAAQATELESKGYLVQGSGNAPTSGYTGVKIYDLTNDSKKATKHGLEKRYGTSAVGDPSPITPPAGTAFVIIFGQTTATSAN